MDFEKLFKKTALKSDYLFWIDRAEDLDELERIVERAADDETLTDSEYCDIVEKAQEKERFWTFGCV